MVKCSVIYLFIHSANVKINVNVDLPDAVVDAGAPDGLVRGPLHGG